MNDTTYIADYIPRIEADLQITRLWETLAWVTSDSAPRREYWMNDYARPYTYGSGINARTYDAQPDDLFVLGIRERLNRDFGIALDCCFINGYEHQRQHLGWHADDSPEINPDQPIAVISLGAEREIWTRPKNDQGAVTKLLLNHGSLFLMPPGMQQTHDHRIPKASREVGPRISLTYRGLVSD